jgi:hypothetical protein
MASPHGQHAVDAEHRRMSVVGGQGGANLVVRHHLQVDQEPKNARAQEVPESNRD